MNAGEFDLIVLGSGPGGFAAALVGASTGARTALVEAARSVGGACVHRGTIPSKALRETALRVSRAHLGEGLARFELRADVELKRLMGQVDSIARAHAGTMQRQLERAGVRLIHGRARFLEPGKLEVRQLQGAPLLLAARAIVIATGSRPRQTPAVPIDHENVLDSDSILSMLYLPRSLAVLGGGVVACEYASIFAHLGVAVTIIDRAPQPLAFLDSEVTASFLERFGDAGGTYLGEREIVDVRWDGVSRVDIRLRDGGLVTSDKVLAALGRVANVAALELERTGLAPNERGLLAVDERCRTAVAGLWAVGDVIGPPALAATAMEQGRRAARDALGLALGHPPEMAPVGIYTVPEIASVGLTEAEARARGETVVVGRAHFDEVARGRINGDVRGLLKLVVRCADRRVLGAQLVGEGVTEIVHVAQVALIAGWAVDEFVDNVFNFPTLAEAYRLAALDAADQLPALRASAAEWPAARSA